MQSKVHVSRSNRAFLSPTRENGSGSRTEKGINKLSQTRLFLRLVPGIVYNGVLGKATIQSHSQLSTT